MCIRDRAIITLASGATQADDIYDMGNVNREVVLDGGDSNDSVFVTHGTYDGGGA